MTIRFRQVDKDKFLAVKSGLKPVETRAATAKYQKVQAGGIVTFVCGDDRFNKTIKAVRLFPTISAMLKVYKPAQILPGATSDAELEAMYFSFPGYKQKIEQYGLVAWELETI